MMSENYGYLDWLKFADKFLFDIHRIGKYGECVQDFLPDVKVWYFEEPLGDIEGFIHNVFNGPIFWGIETRLSDDGEDGYYKVPGVDLSSGEKINIEICSEWIRIYVHKSMNRDDLSFFKRYINKIKSLEEAFC